MDGAPRLPTREFGRRLTRIVGWVLILVSLPLLWFAVWAHLTLEPIIGLFFVGIAGLGGLSLLLAGIGMVATGRVSSVGGSTMFWP